MSRGQASATGAPCAQSGKVALPTSALAPISVDIITAKLMTAFAVGLPGLLSRWRLTAQHVLTVRDRLQVIGIHARRIVAGVVKLLTVRDRANQQFINQAVSERGSARPIRSAANFKRTVAARLDGTNPEPATISLGRDLGQQPHSGLIVHEYSVT